VTDLEGAGLPFAPKIYHLMLVKFKIWDPKYQGTWIFLLFGGAPPLSGATHPFQNFWIRHCLGKCSSKFEHYLWRRNHSLWLVTSAVIPLCNPSKNGSSVYQTVWQWHLWCGHYCE
jgi:hypothetical protein